MIPKLRFPEFKNTKGWEEKKLGYLTSKIGSGSTPLGGSNVYKTTGLSFIRSQNILDFCFSPCALVFIDNEQSDKLKNASVEKNDILLNITGDSVARCCLVNERYLPSRVSQNVSIIRVIREKANCDFALYSLQSLKKELLSMSENGATRKVLTKGMLEKFIVPVPKAKEQEKIANCLSSIDDIIKYEKQGLEHLQDHKGALMQMLFPSE